MNIDLISDTHLEFLKEPFSNFMKGINWFPKKTNNILVIAGDFITLSEGFLKREFELCVLYALTRLGYEKVFFVCGNHEYYGTSYDSVEDYLRNLEIKNFFYLEMEEEPIPITKEISIIGRNLWSGLQNGNPVICRDVKSSINDFRVISDFSVEKMIEIHKESYKFLKEKTDSSTLVVTHFSPTNLNELEHFRSSPLDPYFNVGIEEYILDKKPPFFFHGHTHTEKDFFLGETHIVCNPWGYEKLGSYSPRRFTIK